MPLLVGVLVLPFAGGVGVTAFCGPLPFENWTLALTMPGKAECIPLRASVSPRESGRTNRQSMAAMPRYMGRFRCLPVPTSSRNTGGNVIWLDE